MSGFVSFVGSGPGDPELLTLKAVDRLKRADAVLFDDLSSGPILSHAAKGADLVGVGKRAGRPSPRQDHVSRLLVDYAAAGARVVRLKSGDGGLFGRLEEELVALRAAGIAYEIVPGVPSASAAAAAAGIPLTRRLTARRVQFVTGHDIDGKLPGDLNLAALADSGGDDGRLHGTAHFRDACRDADCCRVAIRYPCPAGRGGEYAGADALARNGRDAGGTAFRRTGHRTRAYPLWSAGGGRRCVIWS